MAGTGRWFPKDADNRAAGRSCLQVEVIENVEPLDRQFGVLPKKTVPNALHDVLFGQPAPNEAEIAAAVPAMLTFAILDATKVVNLPELLSASGLEHGCLFKDKSYDELKNVAPWVVRLEENNDFTRRLFTGPDGINGLWDKEPGIYVRSRETLDDMWRHFRRFTRVQDENGKWFYFRFWEARAATDTFLSYFDDNLAGIFKNVSCFIVPNGAQTYRLSISGSLLTTPRLILTERGKQNYLARRQTRLSSQIAKHFLTLPEFQKIDERDMLVRVDQYVTKGLELGFREGADLFVFSLGVCLSENPKALLADIEQINADRSMCAAERQERILKSVSVPIERAKQNAGDNNNISGEAE